MAMIIRYCFIFELGEVDIVRQYAPHNGANGQCSHPCIDGQKVLRLGSIKIVIPYKSQSEFCFAYIIFTLVATLATTSLNHTHDTSSTNDITVLLFCFPIHHTISATHDLQMSPNPEFMPLHNICEWLNALHIYADEARKGQTRAVEAHHYCSHVRKGTGSRLLLCTSQTDAYRSSTVSDL